MVPKYREKTFINKTIHGMRPTSEQIWNSSILDILFNVSYIFKKIRLNWGDCANYNNITNYNNIITNMYIYIYVYLYTCICVYSNELAIVPTNITNDS